MPSAPWFRLSTHVLEQMRFRGTDLSSVLAVLKAPDAIIAADRPDLRVLQGIVTTGDPPLRALPRIVVDDAESPPTVVTV